MQLIFRGASHVEENGKIETREVGIAFEENI